MVLEFFNRALFAEPINVELYLINIKHSKMALAVKFL